MSKGFGIHNSMWSFIKHLEAMNELIEDKANLRLQGLTEEEIDGYEEFFFSNYFPKNIEEI